MVEPETPRCIVCGREVTVEDEKISFAPVSIEWWWCDNPPEAPRVEYVLYRHNACRARRPSRAAH
jgi:hypothetical protein